MDGPRRVRRATPAGWGESTVGRCPGVGGGGARWGDHGEGAAVEARESPPRLASTTSPTRPVQITSSSVRPQPQVPTRPTGPLPSPSSVFGGQGWPLLLSMTPGRAHRARSAKEVHRKAC